MALTKISTDGVKDDAVTAGKIPANAVGSSELADNAVDTAAIADDAVTADKIADGTITTTQIANDAVTRSRIQDEAVDADRLAASAVTTAKIADQAVTLAKLPHGDGSNDGKFLRANNGADPTFETVNTDLVSDSSPQLGGDLDTNSHHILLDDDHELKLGNSTDLEIWHSSNSNSYIKNNTGELKLASDNIALMTTDQSEKFIDCNGNGNVELFYDNSKKLETISDGIRVTDYIKFTGTGCGIDFGSTSNASGMSSEVLDDYEEGSWSPSLRFGGGSTGMSYNTRQGKYTRIGNLVTFSFRINLSAKGSSTGDAIVYGLPFNVWNTEGAYSGATFGWLNNLTNAHRWSCTQIPTLDINGNYIYLRRIESSSNNGLGHTQSDFTDSHDMIMQGLYYTI